MKVLLVGNYPPDRLESMRRFAQFLQAQLLQQGLEVRVLLPPVIFGRWARPGGSPAKWLGYVDRFILFPPRLRVAGRWADIVHICDHANAVYVPRRRRKPYVVTCHDLTAIRSALGETLEFKTRWSGRIFQRWILKGLRRSRWVVCVSKQTGDDFVRIAGGPRSHVMVVHNALNYDFRPMEEEQARRRLESLGLKEMQPFLVHVGGDYWYKNREGLLRIFAHLRLLPGGEKYRLVIVGQSLSPRMRGLLGEMGLQHCIVELTGIGGEDLRAIYSTACGLLFPSLYEGFGWPVIEAQACGCPVFGSNRRPITDIGGSAAVYFDPADEQAAAELVLAGLADSRALADKGKENAARFSADRMRSGYLEVYEDARRDGNS